MKLGLGLGVGFGSGRRSAVWTPAQLFAASEQGAWYDPSDSSTVFQDSAATIPASVGDPVGAILDKSGNGNHAIQVTTSDKPILRQDGNGNYYLEFDGFDDWVGIADLGITQPTSQGIAVSTATNGDIFLDGDSINTGSLYTNSDRIRLYAGATLLSSNNYDAVNPNIITTAINGASSWITLNGTKTAGDAGNLNTDGISFGGSLGGGLPSNCDIYGVVVTNDLLSDEEVSLLTNYLATKAGTL